MDGENHQGNKGGGKLPLLVAIATIMGGVGAFIGPVLDYLKSDDTSPQNNPVQAATQTMSKPAKTEKSTAPERLSASKTLQNDTRPAISATPVLPVELDESVTKISVTTIPRARPDKKPAPGQFVTKTLTVYDGRSTSVCDGEATATISIWKSGTRPDNKITVRSSLLGGPTVLNMGKVLGLTSTCEMKLLRTGRDMSYFAIVDIKVQN